MPGDVPRHWQEDRPLYQIRPLPFFGYGPGGETWQDHQRFGPRPLPPDPPPPGSAPSAYAAYERAWREYEWQVAAWERNRNGGTL